MKPNWKVFSVLLLGVAATCVSQSKSDTPRIIEVITEEGVPAEGLGLKAVLLRMKSQPASDLHWIGAEVIAGDLNHAVAIFPHENYASLQQSRTAIHSAWESLPPSQRPKLVSRVYEFTPDQAYNDGHVRWSEAHAFGLLFVQLSAGEYDEYVYQQHLASEYLVKAQIHNEEWLGYDLHYGPESPAYLFVTPLRSIADLDISEPHGPILPELVDRARSQVLLKAVKNNSVSLIQVQPELSHVQP
jgi:hypothetical protein